MTDFCLTILCPSAVEEKLLDLLLMTANLKMFTSAPTAAHGLHTDSFSQSEQVLGRAFATQVQVLLTEEDKQALVENMHAQFAGAGLRYWLTPVIEAGEIA